MTKSRTTIRFPEWVLEYFDDKSEQKSIPKTSLMRSYLIEKVREKEDLEPGVEYGGNKDREEE